MQVAFHVCLASSLTAYSLTQTRQPNLPTLSPCLYIHLEPPDQIASKLDAADKSTIDSKISETIAWLDANQNAEKEEYEEKQKALEAVCNPIMQKLAGAGGMPGGMPDMSGAGFPDGGASGAPTADADADAGPKIEEID